MVFTQLYMASVRSWHGKKVTNGERVSVFDQMNLLFSISLSVEECYECT